MPEDRDHRRRRTPPTGVRRQLAQEQDQPQSWDDDQTPPPVPDAPEVSAEVAARDQLGRIGRRVKLTTRTTLAVLDLAGTMRRDFDGKLEGVGRELSELRAVMARNEGKLGILVDSLEADRQARRQFDEAAVASLRAGVEITRTRALSEIEIERTGAAAKLADRAERGKYWRDVGIRILAGVAAVWAVISTILLARYGMTERARSEPPQEIRSDDGPRERQHH